MNRSAGVARFLPSSLLRGACLATGLLAIGELPALDEIHSGVFIGFDNDTFAARDDYYSNGLYAGYARLGAWQADAKTGVFSLLPGIGREGEVRQYTATVLHRIFTPEDIDESEPILDDIPYSGQLVANFTVASITQESSHSWTLVAGVTGPASGAEHLQTTFHEVAGFDEVNGWDNQLHNEVLLNLIQINRYRLHRQTGERWGWELMPSVAWAAGNLASYLELGIGLRAGLRLPDHFRLPAPLYADPAASLLTLTQDSRATWYGTVFLAGNLIGNNITWDGNTFRDSQQVDYEHWTLRAHLGITREGPHFIANVSATWATIPFPNPADREDDIFGSFALTFTF